MVLHTYLPTQPLKLISPNYPPQNTHHFECLNSDCKHYVIKLGMFCLVLSVLPCLVTVCHSNMQRMSMLKNSSSEHYVIKLDRYVLF